MEGTTQPGRGEHMQLVLQYEWLDHAKVGELEPKEETLKEAIYQWFTGLDRAALERVRFCFCVVPMCIEPPQRWASIFICSTCARLPKLMCEN